MAITSQGTRTAVQVVLGLIIIGLSYFLYRSITEPYDRIERQRQLTEQTRERMGYLRTALNGFERDSSRFPDSLEVLMRHLRNDSLTRARPDSVFGAPVNLDSLLHSPRTGKRFQYAVSDTGRVETYLLQDPDSDDEIGTLSGDPTQTNQATWE